MSLKQCPPSSFCPGLQRFSGLITLAPWCWRCCWRGRLCFFVPGILWNSMDGEEAGVWDYAAMGLVSGFPVFLIRVAWSSGSWHGRSGLRRIRRHGDAATALCAGDERRLGANKPRKGTQGWVFPIPTSSAMVKNPLAQHPRTDRDPTAGLPLQNQREDHPPLPRASETDRLRMRIGSTRISIERLKWCTSVTGL